MGIKIIVIGTSLGGVDTLTRFFSCLPGNFFVPIAVVIHRGNTEFDYLINVLQKSTPINIVEAWDKLPISSREIVIAPADYHLLVGQDHYALSVDAPVYYARPSIDVLFESAADQFGPKAVGILLTGGGIDGVQGLGKISSRQGPVFAQSPDTALDPSLPQAALDAGIVTVAEPIDEIVAKLLLLCDQPADRTAQVIG